jgi:pre-60S factor REI1
LDVILLLFLLLLVYFEDESKGISLLTCLFCEHESTSMEQKCEHMAREHSFYIPDIEHVGDFEGLFRFLGIKIGVYHVCLWCSNKCYPTLKAVQQHMFDKGHFKIRFESDTLYEYADFYSFDDDSDDDYEDDDEDMSDDGAANDVNNFIEDESYELVLPSGT